MRKKVIAIIPVVVVSTYVALYIDISPTRMAPRSTRKDSILTGRENIFAARRDRTKCLCEHLFGVKQNNERISLTNSSQKKPSGKPRLFYGDKLKVLLCDTPKCGGSEWRHVVLITDKLVKFNSSDQIKNLTGDQFRFTAKHRYISGIGNLPFSHPNNTDVILNEYFKVMTVREPLERLVSAYKDKLERKHDRYYVPVSQRIHKRYGNGSKGLATFSEFIQQILDTKNPASLDPHWKPYTHLCDPCRMNYDYIVKMETIYDDVAYLSEKLGFDKRIAFNGDQKEALRKKWETTYFQYYKQLPAEKRKAIFEYYRRQYDLFGYDYPDLDL